MRNLVKVTNKIRYIVLILLWIPRMTMAEETTDILGDLEDIGGTVYGDKAPSDIKVVIANVVQVILGFVGVLFTVLILWGGFKWMTSGGNEQKITEAKKHLVQATIGLVIVVTAYAISLSVTKWLLAAAGNN